MNIHEDIERQANEKYSDPVHYKDCVANDIARAANKAHISAATAERVKGMAFAEWCSRKDWHCYKCSDGIIWMNRYNTDSEPKTTSQLFLIFLQNETK